MDFKNINIGSLIKTSVAEKNIEMPRICKFLNSSEKEILQMYESADLNAGILLRWSKLLEYDLFRLYSQHLVLYSPQSSANYNHISENKQSKSLPQFRKNIYTKDIIEFILEKIDAGKMTKMEVINEYKIPKTTLYKWLHKYQSINNEDH